MDGYWMIRTYEAGSIGEKTKYFIPGNREKRSLRRERDAIKKAEQNEHSAQKRCARLLNANFRKNDLFIGLDYSAEGMAKLEARCRDRYADFDTAEEPERADMLRTAAAREAELLFRRVNRRLKQLGMEELKYWGVTSDMDADTGELKRVHHHFVVQAGVEEVIREKWGKRGGVSWTRLFEQFGAEDFTAIAVYCLKQVRRIPDGNKYTSSRNLIRPKPKDRVAYGDSLLKAPAGARVLYQREYQPMRPQYIRYLLPPERRRGPDGRLLAKTEAQGTGERIATSPQAAPRNDTETAEVGERANTVRPYESNESSYEGVVPYAGERIATSPQATPCNDTGVWADAGIGLYAESSAGERDLPGDREGGDARG